MVFGAQFMSFAKFGTAASVIAVALAAPAWAGDEVQYDAPPEWVAPIDMGTAADAGEDIVLYDRQVRLDGGVVTRYTDIAYNITNTQALQRFGTLQFAWLPDKGDLTFHRLELIRGDEVIDLLAQGVQPEVIRRERQLERRSVDGQLTAVVAVPGMEVGDILRMATSTTLRDQALQDEMQALEGVVAEPTRLGLGRLRVSWPADSDVVWGMMGDLEKPEVIEQGDDRLIEIILPIDKPEEMPQDAPARFRASPLLQFGTFASWEEVSQVMAPHFATQGAIAPGGEIDAEVKRIMATTDAPLERAALALELVQDEISYLLNGMDGGNYLPQSPQETWEKKFGDCKAKSVLLLAMLHEMGIEAEVVLADIDFGDAVSISQPVPGAFDHMIVHAKIDGKDYWLDGTDAGGRLATIDKVPDFTWVLPLRTEGAGLVRLEQRWPQMADRSYDVTIDMRAGVDLPTLYQIDFEARGGIGAQLRALAVENDAKTRISHANGFFDNIMDGVIYDAAYSYDDESGVAKVTAKGMTFGAFQLERDTATHAVASVATNWRFNPDRARSAWRDIPFRVGGPYTAEQDTTFLLPDDGKGVQIDGGTALDTQVAGTKFKRSSLLDDDTFTVSERVSFIPGEISPDDIREGKTATRRISSSDPKIKISGATRYWELDDQEIARRMAQFQPAGDQLIETYPEEANMYLVDAFISMFARQYEAALDDFSKVIELGATADAYINRAGVLLNLGRVDEALADAERAFDLQGDVGAASVLAQVMALSGRADDALDLLDSLGLTGDEAVDALAAWSELSGYVDRQEEAWYRLQDMLVDRPDDVGLLNSKCWLAGLWSYNLDEAKPVCDEAVTLSGQSASVIDSRAMLHYRMGNIDDALADIDLALSKEPELAASRYLRGVIRLEQGDKRGQEDILFAKRISPDIELRYAAYGLGT